MADARDYEQEIAERVARLRDIASVEIHGLIEELLARTDLERQESLDAAVAERDAAIAQALDGAAAESAAETDASIARALADVAESGPRALLAGVRRIDAATTLSGVLDVLVDVVAREAGRAALFVATGDAIRGWRFAGFDEAMGDPMDYAAGGIDPALMDRAVSEGSAAVDAGRGAMAVPVVVGGELMALLYADDARAARDDGAESGKAGDAEAAQRAPHWIAGVEVLARYAGCRLESITANRVAALAAGNARDD